LILYTLKIGHPYDESLLNGRLVLAYFRQREQFQGEKIDQQMFDSTQPLGKKNGHQSGGKAFCSADRNAAK